MKKNWTGIFALVIAVLTILSLFSACGGQDNQQTASAAQTTEQTKAAEVQNYYDMLDNVSDSSELPDWTGKQLSLKVWYAHGTGDAKREQAPNDVVSPEVKRVTGVSLDGNGSFDNGGQAADVKLGMLTAANDFPSIVDTTDTVVFDRLVKAGKLYDLTDLIKQYCPDLLKKVPFDQYPAVTENIAIGGDSKIYFYPHQMGNTLVYDTIKDHPDFDISKYTNINPPQPISDWPRIWVRDDLLQKLYPNAMTQNQIEETYMQNGQFTREQIFDVPIKSKDDFVKFLYDMKTLIEKEGIKEGKKPVQTTYGAEGLDNWALMACMLPAVDGIPGRNNYYTYYDKTAGSIQYMFAQGFFKDDLKQLTQLVHDGVISKESLLDNNQIFTQKLNNGEYAVTYGWFKPDESVIKQAGKTYRYRLLWPDVTYQNDKYASIDTAPRNQMSIGIFKDSVAEEDLPQLLRYLNFMTSDVGEKLLYWGPKTAGLWDENDGKRVFKDKDLEDNMVYGKDNGKNLEYNLYNGIFPDGTKRSAWPYLAMYADATQFSPRYTYERTRNVGEADNFFNPGQIKGQSLQENIVYANFSPEYWNLMGKVAGIDQFSKGKDAFEKALTRILATKDDAQFEQQYKIMLDTASKLGLNDGTLAEINKVFVDGNPGIADKLK